MPKQRVRPGRRPRRPARAASRAVAERPAASAPSPAVAPVAPARPLRIAALATAIEAAALAASALGLTIYQLIGNKPHDPLDAWLVVAMAAIGAVGLALTARGLYRGRRWARSPSVLTQLIALPVGGTAIGNGGAWFGGPLLVCALVALAGLFAPSSTRIYSGR